MVVDVWLFKLSIMWCLVLLLIMLYGANVVVADVILLMLLLLMLLMIVSVVDVNATANVADVVGR